jgi:16S rRNA (adenine1518-N6/adenine1519-N6)-dimethyltransferase
VSVAPKKQLGQHFLVDENILGVIDRLAELADDDVVLEVGPGLGVLTRYLAARVDHVHAVELDRSLEPKLRFGSIPRRSSPPRRSSSRTCRTTSRPRSSPRASTGFRA